MDKIKLALIQMKVTPDKGENISRAETFVQAAVEQGAHMAVLPEMFCCPYDTPNFPKYAEPQGGETFCALSSMARNNRLWLVGGSVPEEEDGHVYNTAYIFAPDGHLAGKHRKVHLFDIDVAGGQRFFESDTLTAGSSVTVVEDGPIPFGVCVCYDFRFPELSRIMALRGAKLIVVPAAFNGTTGPAHWELLVRQRAVDNQVFTAAVAPARDEEASYVSHAHSMAVDPWGTVLTDLGTGETMKLVTLDLERLEQVRSQLPLLRQRRTYLYEIKEVYSVSLTNRRSNLLGWNACFRLTDTTGK